MWYPAFVAQSKKNVSLDGWKSLVFQEGAEHEIRKQPMAGDLSAQRL